MPHLIQRVDIVVIVGKLIQDIFRSLRRKLRLGGSMAAVNEAASMVAQLQEKIKEVPKILPVLKADSQTLAFVNDVLNVFVHP